MLQGEIDERMEHKIFVTAVTEDSSHLMRWVLVMVGNEMLNMNN